jgi:hypothetical protein
VPDAAREILTRDPEACAGRVDEDVLRQTGVTDFARYRADSSSGKELMGDLFL